METRSTGNYDLASEEMVAEGADLRVKVLTLAPGQCVPWHYHSQISDHFVCLKGHVVVETRAPRATHVLEPGERCAVRPKTVHTVHGGNDTGCQFLIIQGVGIYDYVGVGAAPEPADP
jgi:quercetin dioxygenase-like cupin family protein